MAVLSVADRAVGRLAGEGRRLPNPYLLIRPFVRREAVLSFWTAGKLAERLEVAFTAAQRAIDRLESTGIVTLATEARRNRVCCARAILELLEGPPRRAAARGARRGRRT